MSKNQAQVLMRDGKPGDENLALNYYNGFEYLNRAYPDYFQCLCTRTHRSPDVEFSEGHKRYLCEAGLADINPETGLSVLRRPEEEIRRYIKLCSRSSIFKGTLAEIFSEKVCNRHYRLVTPFHQSLMARVKSFVCSVQPI